MILYIANNIKPCISYSNIIYIYIFVKPFLSARKLLPQRACDRRETRDYSGAPHGGCHKGVDGRQLAAPAKSTARFPSLTENDAMIFIGLRTANTRFWIIKNVQQLRNSRRSKVDSKRCALATCMKIANDSISI